MRKRLFVYKFTRVISCLLVWSILMPIFSTYAFAAGTIAYEIKDDIATLYSVKYSRSLPADGQPTGSYLNLTVDAYYNFPSDKLGHQRLSPSFFTRVSTNEGQERMSWAYVTVDNQGGRIDFKGGVGLDPEMLEAGGINVTIYYGFLAYDGFEGYGSGEASKFYIAQPYTFQVNLTTQPSGTINVNHDSTDPSDPETGGSEDEVTDISEFDPTIYRANYLHNNAQIPAQGVNRSITETSPSEIFVDALQESGAVDMMDVWESFELISEAVDDPTALYDFAAEPKDLYSAVILNALEASVSYDVISSDVENALKDCNSFVSNTQEWMNNIYGIDIQQANNFRNLNTDQRMKLAELTDAWFKENQPDLCSIADVFKKVSTGMNVVGSIEDYFERIVSCAIVANTNEYMKDVLRQVYQDSLSTGNIYLQSALSDCVEIMNSSTEAVIQKIITDEFVAVGTDAAKYLIKEVLWDQVTKTLYATHPAVAVFQTAYKTGKFVSNLLFNTDATTEQYAKMDAIVDVENLVDTTYKKLGDSFESRQDVTSATIYLNALDLIFTLRDNDCVRAYELVDILDSALVNQIAKLFGGEIYDYSGTKSYLRTRQVNYAVEHETALTAWIYELEVDYPDTGLEEQYNSWFEQSAERMANKEFVAACPVDVYVYDASNNIVASVVNGRVSCENPDIMIALIDDTKVVRFYGSQNYRIEYKGTDTGNMDITVSEFDDTGAATRKVNYYNVPLSNQTQYDVTVDADQDSQTYALQYAGSVIPSNYDSASADKNMHNITVQSGSLLRNGEIFLKTQATAGETMELNAYVPADCQFVRWESSNNENIFANSQSQNTTFIMPDEDVVIQAVLQFPEGMTPPSSETPNDDSCGNTETPPSDDSSSDSNVSDGSTSSPNSSDGNSPSSSNRYTIFTPDSIDNGSIRVNPNRAERGDTVTITVDPDEDYELYMLVVTDSLGNRIAVEKVSDTRYTFEMPSGRVSIDATFTEVVEQPHPSSEPFVDVSDNDWFYDAVTYVYENGMMNGTSNNLFTPNGTTTRAMIVTILHRLEGEPSVSASRFTDVASNMYYADAVAWAQKNGIVNGTSATAFSPNNPITREQMAAILYRYAQFKGYDISAVSNLSVYRDVSQISSYALSAIQWANAEGLITGDTSVTINPLGSATRAEAATILMRFCENIA